ncbi:hypothetical protein L4X63_14735 [Geomonas sp. Red32]|uniref:hypothetical protein n=1 Tax=Geomonas sp. Red32 TaxID=2912856 RepID=UPI00202CE83D|nr:hypothetical protein [Geomonas sp. Red32]MCM0082848.1 hypothetical protein [Geomonas sp. Red32]
MKIFLYSPDSGFYQGEDFADAGAVAGGPPALPEGATHIAPPAVGPDQVPVFSVTEQCWKVLPHPARVRRSAI